MGSVLARFIPCGLVVGKTMYPYEYSTINALFFINQK